MVHISELSRPAKLPKEITKQFDKKLYLPTSEKLKIEKEKVIKEKSEKIYDRAEKSKEKFEKSKEELKKFGKSIKKELGEITLPKFNIQKMEKGRRKLSTALERLYKAGRPKPQRASKRNILLERARAKNIQLQREIQTQRQAQADAQARETDPRYQPEDGFLYDDFPQASQQISNQSQRQSPHSFQDKQPFHLGTSLQSLYRRLDPRNRRAGSNNQRPLVGNRGRFVYGEGGAMRTPHLTLMQGMPKAPKLTLWGSK